MEKIIFTKGDDAALQVRIKRNGEYIDLTGYSFETYFRKEDGEIYTVPNEDHEINEDQETNPGKMIVNIASVYTATFRAGPNLTFITKVTNPSGKSVHYRGTGLLFIMESEP